ncbi:hypothetical protein AOLI_G00087730 [Acnodon oligacanthus]
MDAGPSREGAFPQPGPRQARVTQRGPREARQQTTTGSTLSLKEAFSRSMYFTRPPAGGSRIQRDCCLLPVFTFQLQLSVCGDSRDGASCCATGETEP